MHILTSDSVNPYVYDPENLTVFPFFTTDKELEMMNTLLMSKQNTITSLELPTSIAEIDEQKEIFQSIVTDLNASEDKLQEVMEYGLELAANQEKAIASAVIEKLENLNSEWSEVLILCNHQIGSLSRQRSIQASFLKILNFNLF